LDLEKGMMDCLYAKCTPCITDCVMAELEKLGQKYRVALRYVPMILQDTYLGSSWEICFCLFFNQIALLHPSLFFLLTKLREMFVWKQHKCYIVATCDRDLKRRIRKV
ncbi:hypothetical protein C3L33_13672, partial [Rhododendron williamsianum]